MTRGRALQAAGARRLGRPLAIPTWLRAESAALARPGLALQALVLRVPALVLPARPRTPEQLAPT